MGSPSSNNLRYRPGLGLTDASCEGCQGHLLVFSRHQEVSLLGPNGQNSFRLPLSDLGGRVQPQDYQMDGQKALSVDLAPHGSFLRFAVSRVFRFIHLASLLQVPVRSVSPCPCQLEVRMSLFCVKGYSPPASRVAGSPSVSCLPC